MRRKKLWKTSLGAVLAGCLLLTGCAGKKEEAPILDEKQIDSKVEQIDSEVEHTLGIRPVSTSSSYSTDTGYYYLSQDIVPEVDGMLGTTILYVDYATKQEVFLCNKPNCSHQDGSCQAVLADGYIEHVLFGDGNYIYTLASNGDSSRSMATVSAGGDDGGFLSPSGAMSEEQPPTLTRRLPDGSGEEIWYTFPSGVTVEDQLFADENHIYAIQKTISSKQEVSGFISFVADNRKLVSIDRNTKQAQEAVSLPIDDKILGAFGNCLILERIQYQQELSAEEMMDDDIWKAAYEQADCMIYTLDIATGEEKELYRCKGEDNHSVLANGQMVYVCNSMQKVLQQINAESGETKTILQGNSFMTEKYHNLTEILGDILLCNSSNGGGEGFTLYMISISDGSITPSTLVNSTGNPIDILAQSETQLYVCYDFITKTEHIDWAGVDQESIVSSSYGLIRKEDFLNNQASYEKVATLERDD